MCLSSHVSKFFESNYNLQNMSKINSQSLSCDHACDAPYKYSAQRWLSTTDSSSAAGLNASHPHHRVEQLQIDTEQIQSCDCDQCRTFISVRTQHNASTLWHNE